MVPVHTLQEQRPRSPPASAKTAHHLPHTLGIEPSSHPHRVISMVQPGVMSLHPATVLYVAVTPLRKGGVSAIENACASTPMAMRWISCDPDEAEIPQPGPRSHRCASTNSDGLNPADCAIHRPVFTGAALPRRRAGRLRHRHGSGRRRHRRGHRRDRVHLPCLPPCPPRRCRPLYPVRLGGMCPPGSTCRPTPPAGGRNRHRAASASSIRSRARPC